MTMGTIAERVGVSRATVSNAYNRPDQLSAELRDRILQTAAALGYPGPDPVGRMLRRRTAGAIGLVQPSLRYALTDAANLMLLDGVADVCEAEGLALVLVPGTRPAEDRIDVLASTAIDGVVAHCDSLDDARRAIVLARQLPLVVLDGAIDVDARSVGIDDAGGARLAAEHVIALGHRRVAVMAIGRPDRSITSLVRERLAGYTSALERAGLDAPVVVVTTGYQREFGEASARELLARPDPPTAILAMSDELAAGVLDAARSLDINVPTTLSVVGFDDTATASTTDPPLTTVHQDHAAKGRAAVKMLLDPTARPHHLRLPVEIVVRASTAHPPRE